MVAECLLEPNRLLGDHPPGCYAIHDTGIYLDAQSKGNTTLPKQTKVTRAGGWRSGIGT
ncbi:hypothetical protein O9992_23365 [Vibrio lentus]|nr:hypothetical protein [Vibrio lentus]